MKNLLKLAALCALPMGSISAAPPNEIVISNAIFGGYYSWSYLTSSSALSFGPGDPLSITINFTEPQGLFWDYVGGEAFSGGLWYVFGIYNTDNAVPGGDLAYDLTSSFWEEGTEVAGPDGSASYSGDGGALDGLFPSKSYETAAFIQTLEVEFDQIDLTLSNPKQDIKSSGFFFAIYAIPDSGSTFTLLLLSLLILSSSPLLWPLRGRRY